jgi:hypothetical protein
MAEHYNVSLPRRARDLRPEQHELARRLHAILNLFAYYSFFPIMERVGRYVPCNRS